MVYAFEEVMKKVNSIHKSPRMFCLGGHILGQLLACKPTLILVYPVFKQRGTVMVNANESYTRLKGTEGKSRHGQ